MFVYKNCIIDVIFHLKKSLKHVNKNYEKPLKYVFQTQNKFEKF